MHPIIQKLQQHQAGISKLLPFNITPDEILHLDLSSKNKALAKFKTIDQEVLGNFIRGEMKNAHAKIAIGGYFEDRLIYKRSPHFGSGENARTVHLGIDIWCDEYTPVQAPLHGKVHSFQVNDNFADYGPTIILQHCPDNLTFYTLYGHLSSDCLKSLKVGQNIAAGEPFAELGNSNENGHWPPHLHFQIITNMQGFWGDSPGVCSKKDISKYRNRCLDPFVLLKF